MALLALAAPASAAIRDRPDLDLRVRAATHSAAARAAIARAATPATAALARRLGSQGVLELDPLTGTPRTVARLDGFLTGPSARPAAAALDYVRAHRSVFRLTNTDLAGLRLEQDRTAGNIRQLIWAQTYKGVPLFADGLRANFANGRLLSVGGSPQAGLAVRTTKPALTATGALARARADAGAPRAVPRVRRAAGGALRQTTFADGSAAQLTIFPAPSGNRLAWHLYTQLDSQHVYEEVVDATTGGILFRQNIVHSDSGSRWLLSPSPTKPGNSQDLFAYPPSWGPFSGAALSGAFAHVYADPNDDDTPTAGDEIPASGTGADNQPSWDYPFHDQTASPNALGCVTPPNPPDYPCSWQSQTPNSWQTNERQEAAQLFFYVNNFHDWLRDNANIGFTPALGNFEGADAVQAQVDDGAATNGGGPDDNHINNANMATEQDGVPPRMQMYLFSGQGFIDGNGADEADVVYHEYTHGLSSRLITDAQGFPRLDSEEANSMGEGWSDFYALDYIVRQGLLDDTTTAGDLVLGFYLGQGKSLFRSEGIDCRPTDTDPTQCPGGDTGHSGGYTLADFGHICCNGPEVHADGEIWVQTLWQIRQTLSSDVAERLVTQAMILGPTDPSMLDERNAVLQSDQASFGGAHRNALWAIFAQRGMGFFASDLGSADVTPQADFHTPPAPGSPTSTISGTITDADTHAGLAGVRIAVQSHPEFTATTNALGRYAITGVPPGTYRRLVAAKATYDTGIRQPLTVGSGGAVADFRLPHDWASAAGGASIPLATKPDLGPGCNPPSLLDQSSATGWASYNAQYPGGENGLPLAPATTRTAVIKLPVAVDVVRFGVDPGAVCGDDDSASLGDWTLEVSSDGDTFANVPVQPWAQASNHRVNTIPMSKPLRNVRYVRITMAAPQNPAGSAGQKFLDMAEFEVYGAPSPAPDRKKPVLTVTTAKLARHSLAPTLHRGLVVFGRSNEAGRVSLATKLNPALLRRLKLSARKAFTIKPLRVTLKRPGRGRFVVHFSAAAQRKILALGRKQRTLNVALTLSGRDQANNAATKRRTIILRR